MDDVAQQLRSEIAALEEHIARTQDRFIATRWLAELLPALRRASPHLDAAETNHCLDVLRRARSRFHVNGQLSVELDELLSHHVGQPSPTRPPPEPAAGINPYAEVVLPPGQDPGDTAEGTAHVLFEEEDEEIVEDESVAAEVADGADGASAQTDDLFADNVDGPPAEVWVRSPAGHVPAPAPPTSETMDPGAMDELFTDRAPAPAPAADGLSSSDPEAPNSDAKGAAAEMDALFADQAGQTEPARPARPRPSRPPKEPAPGMPRAAPEAGPATIHIFSQAVALDDLQAALDITIPPADLTQL
ncbi:MAG: hypothetical protein ABIL09_26760, partial [Gemmatimonadota bacterium]